MQWLADFIRNFYEDMLRWCRKNPSWWLRAPLIAYFLYIFINHLLDPNYQSLFGALNLGIHELGHYLLCWAGEFLHAAGGTIWQCLAPIIAMYVFYRIPDFFAISFCFGWLSTNFYNVATYVADARRHNLILVTPGGGEAKHDWTYMLGRLGMLEWDDTFALILRIAAFISMIIFFVGGSWILYQCAKKPPPEPMDYESALGRKD